MFTWQELTHQKDWTMINNIFFFFTYFTGGSTQKLCSCIWSSMQPSCAQLLWRRYLSIGQELQLQQVVFIEKFCLVERFPVKRHYWSHMNFFTVAKMRWECKSCDYDLSILETIQTNAAITPNSSLSYEHEPNRHSWDMSSFKHLTCSLKQTLWGLLSLSLIWNILIGFSFKANKGLSVFPLLPSLTAHDKHVSRLTCRVLLQGCKGT